jgi:hypothetical protein
MKFHIRTPFVLAVQAIVQMLLYVALSVPHTLRSLFPNSNTSTLQKSKRRALSPQLPRGCNLTLPTRQDRELYLKLV